MIEQETPKTEAKSPIDRPLRHEGFKILAISPWQDATGHFSLAIPPPSGLVYPVREWVSPKSGAGPLTVFESWHWTERYRQLARVLLARLPNGYRVFRCEYEKALDRMVWLSGIEVDTQGEPVASGYRGVEDLTQGTVLASRVRLTEPVDLP